MPWRRLLNRVCRPQDMCLVYRLLWQNYVWKSLFLEKIRTLSACKDSWMEARLWPNVRSRLSWKTRKWSFLQCHPIHLVLTSFWQLFDNFLVASFSIGQSKCHTRGSRMKQKWYLTSPPLKVLAFFLLSPPIDANRKLSKSRQNCITFSSGNQSVSNIPKGPIKKLLTLGQRL